MGNGKHKNLVNVIDFSLAKKFRDPQTHLHIPYRENMGLTGTAQYASISAHLGVEQACRDDLESLAYTLLYFLCGALPWQHVRTTTKKREDGRRIMQKKVSTPTDVLCHSFPLEFGIFLDYARALRFDDKPDYSYLRNLFRDLFVQKGFQYDYMFDWSVQCNVQETVEEDDEHCASDMVLVSPSISFMSLLMYTLCRLRSHTVHRARQTVMGNIE